MIQERVKALRKHLDLSQAEFGKQIGVSRDVISNLEYGRVTVSDLIINMICAKFGVNEQWLRTGEGEMFPPMTPDMKVAKLFGSIMKEDLSDFKQELLETYAGFIVSLSEEEAGTLINLLDKFTEAHNKTKEKK